MTDQEAKALEAAYRNLPTDIRMAFPSYKEAITNFANAYHAAMIEGQVVISRDILEKITRYAAEWDVLRAQLGEGK